MTDKITQNSINEFREYLAGRGKGKGEVIQVNLPELSVAEIRKELSMTQAEFAQAFCIALNTIKNWEQGIRKPDAAARSYLVTIKYAPSSVLAALEAYRQETSVSESVEESNIISLDNLSSKKSNALLDRNPVKSQSQLPLVTNWISKNVIISLNAPVRLAASSSASSATNQDYLNVLATVDFETAPGFFHADEKGNILLAGVTDKQLTYLKINSRRFKLRWKDKLNLFSCVGLGMAEFREIVKETKSDIEVALI